MIILWDCHNMSFAFFLHNNYKTKLLLFQHLFSQKLLILLKTYPLEVFLRELLDAFRCLKWEQVWSKLTKKFEITKTLCKNVKCQTRSLTLFDLLCTLFIDVTPLPITNEYTTIYQLNNSLYLSKGLCTHSNLLSATSCRQQAVHTFSKKLQQH